jgi:uncharacterized protein
MPITSSRSSLKRWPSPEQVLRSAEAWAWRLASTTPTVIAVGCIGSYARGDAGVGSDLDLVVVRADDAPVPDLLGADVDALPVPADVLHYTTSQFARVLAEDGRMARVLRDEARFFVGDISAVSRRTASPSAPPPSPR